jgi:hypothetical protein
MALREERLQMLQLMSAKLAVSILAVEQLE